MARFTIKSRLRGPQTFYVPDDGGYVRLEQGARTGTLGRQICYGGYLPGCTVMADADTLEAVARKWWRQHLKADCAGR